MQAYSNPETYVWIARSIGIVLLISIGLGIFNLSVADSVSIAAGDPAETVTNILAAESLLRLGAASEIFLAMLSIYVAGAFYVLLKPINEFLALLMVLFRLADAALQGVAAILTAQVLQLAKTADSADASALQNIPGALSQLQAAHWDAFHIALMLSSAGSAIAFYLLFQARLIPRVISVWGVIASIGVIASNFAIRIDPAAGDFVYPWYTIANAIAFISLTLWLLIFGISTNRWKEKTSV